MANGVKIVTTSGGNDIPVIIAPPGHGTGVSYVIPKLLMWPVSAEITDVMAEPRDRGYLKHQAGRSNVDDHCEYLKDSAALTDMVSLTHSESGLSQEAAEQMRAIEAVDEATFKRHFPVNAQQHGVDYRFQDGSTVSIDVSQADHALELGGFTPKV